MLNTFQTSYSSSLNSIAYRMIIIMIINILCSIRSVLYINFRVKFSIAN